MQVQYKIGNAVVEVEGKDVKDVFGQLSGAVEVFGNANCGCCRSTAVVPNVRENQGNTYYEMRCTQCGATLGFGQRKADGALYPRRKDKNGEYLENGGWVKFSRRDTVAAADDVAF
jgi:hypothetical protein